MAQYFSHLFLKPCRNVLHYSVPHPFNKNSDTEMMSRLSSHLPSFLISFLLTSFMQCAASLIFSVSSSNSPLKVGWSTLAEFVPWANNGLITEDECENPRDFGGTRNKKWRGDPLSCTVIEHLLRLCKSRGLWDLWDLWDLCSVIEVVWKIYTEARSPIVSTRRASARATRDQNSLARRLWRSNREKLRLNNKRAMALYTCVDMGYEK